MEMDKPPTRLCCGQAHWGAVCPDGLVMCCLCFSRFSLDQLNEADGAKEDVCIQCAADEAAEIERRRSQ